MVVLPDGGATNPQYEPVPNVCYMEVSNLMENEKCLNSEPNLPNHPNMNTDEVNSYSLCNLDVIEKGKAENTKLTEEAVGYLKSDDSAARMIWNQFGEKIMQFLVNRSPELTKFTSKERVSYDLVPINRSRKFRRSASFNSRKVVLLFSIIQSLRRKPTSSSPIAIPSQEHRLELVKARREGGRIKISIKLERLLNKKREAITTLDEFGSSLSSSPLNDAPWSVRTRATSM